VASDIDPSFLKRLREHARRLPNVTVRRCDITQPIPGRYDLVTLFFVIHRLDHWKRAIRRIEQLVAPGGSFFISEFAGPSGMIYLANEKGGRARDPVSRLLRRYFQLVGDPFDPDLKSSYIRPVLRYLSLRPAGHRDFFWKQPVTVGEMHHKIDREVYAPFFSTHPHRSVIEQLRREFEPEWNRRVTYVETIRVYRFTRMATR
jgi:SAM-dependent methyltransferase